VRKRSLSSGAKSLTESVRISIWGERMQIKWHGHACFEISAEEATVVTDPYEPSIGMRLPSIRADVVTVSHEHYDHNYVAAVEGAEVVRGAGEHLVKGIRFLGVRTFHDTRKGAERGENTVFVFELEGIRLCHLGDLGHVLQEEQITAINGVDVLFVPVGGTYTVDAGDAARVVEQLSPKVAIPMHFKIPPLNLNIASEQAFLQEAERRGWKVRKASTLSLSKDTLPAETEVVVLAWEH